MLLLTSCHSHIHCSTFLMLPLVSLVDLYLAGIGLESMITSFLLDSIFCICLQVQDLSYKTDSVEQKKDLSVEYIK